MNELPVIAYSKIFINSAGGSIISFEHGVTGKSAPPAGDIIPLFHGNSETLVQFGEKLALPLADVAQMLRGYLYNPADYGPIDVRGIFPAKEGGGIIHLRGGSEEAILALLTNLSAHLDQSPASWLAKSTPAAARIKKTDPVDFALSVLPSRLR